MMDYVRYHYLVPYEKNEKRRDKDFQTHHIHAFDRGRALELFWGLGSEHWVRASSFSGE